MTLLFDSCSVCGATSSAYGDATTPQGTRKHNNFITVTMMVLLILFFMDLTVKLYTPRHCQVSNNDILLLNNDRRA